MIELTKAPAQDQAKTIEQYKNEKRNEASSAIIMHLFTEKGLMLSDVIAGLGDSLDAYSMTFTQDFENAAAISRDRYFGHIGNALNIALAQANKIDDLIESEAKALQAELERDGLAQKAQAMVSDVAFMSMISDPDDGLCDLIRFALKQSANLNETGRQMIIDQYDYYLEFLAKV